MIQGQLISLRAVEANDVEAFHSWINDDETNQWRGLYHPTSFEEAKDWIETRRATSEERLTLSIIDKNGIHIGFVGLQAISSRSRRAEIWIYIGAKTYWGKGFGEDTIRTLANYALNEMNLYRIWLECNPEFTNIVHCYEKVGFKKEGLLRKAYYRNGAFRDTCIMGLLKEDFIGTDQRGSP